MRYNYLTHVLLALAVAGLLQAVTPFEDPNVAVGFSRTTLAIGTVVNKMNTTDDLKPSERTPAGVAEAFAMEASKQTDANQKKEMHVYSAEIAAGGHSDWHSHPGLEIDINNGNTPLTFYILNRNGTCRKQVLNPGSSLLVLPGETHVAINETGEDGSNLVERIHPSKAIPVTNHELQPLSSTCPLLK